MTQVTVKQCEKPLELYCHYSGQTSPQKCYLYLDMDSGELSCYYDSNIGSTSLAPGAAAERWEIPLMHADTANSLMEEVKDLAKTVFNVYWSNRDYGVGWGERFDWTDAICAVEDYIRDNYDDNPSTHLGVWDAYSWFDNSGPPEELTSEMSDDQIEQLSDRIEAEIHMIDGAHAIVRGVYDYLIDKRNELDSGFDSLNR